MSTQGIQDTIKDIYNVDISSELVSRVTDELKELVDEWRNRPLEAFYPVIFFDALKGVQDVLLAAVDGLTGFPDAVNAVFEKTEVNYV